MKSLILIFVAAVSVNGILSADPYEELLSVHDIEDNNVLKETDDILKLSKKDLEERSIVNVTNINSVLNYLKDLDITTYFVNIMSYIFPNYGKKWMIFPGGDMKLHIINLDFKGIKVVDDDIQNEVTFHLYTRNNNNASQILEPNAESLNKSYLNMNESIKVLIHGWTASYTSIVCQDLKNNYLKVESINIICVDWYPISKDMSYVVPMMKTRYVGQYTAVLLDALVMNGFPAENIHVIGHSLGAHVGGFSGMYFKYGKIGRITGLDPALPGFAGMPANSKLDKSDAKFVDVIHTCAGALGMIEPLGHVDFYPNRGIPPQPGCGGLPPILEACSHGRAVVYYNESIQHSTGFMAQQCNSMLDFNTNRCNKDYIPLGINTPSSARGLFYLKTNGKSPYGRSA